MTKIKLRQEYSFRFILNEMKEKKIPRYHSDIHIGDKFQYFNIESCFFVHFLAQFCINLSSLHCWLANV